jgi:hypothetical protein
VRAARQLHAAGKPARIADHVRYIYVRGEGRVRAWDLPDPPDPKTIDLPRYGALLLRAAHMILQMLGVTEGMLRDWVYAEQGMPVQLPLSAYQRGVWRLETLAEACKAPLSTAGGQAMILHLE